MMNQKINFEIQKWRGVIKIEILVKKIVVERKIEMKNIEKEVDLMGKGIVGHVLEIEKEAAQEVEREEEIHEEIIV